ncbi:hypothetical protein CHS0354_016963 [Potamilus streckersoni]|uniref:Uncharacterized protein n=1 Tax=Potamilus streckersoni TaxID=2493646 RepID=A0AAE0S7N5_9BIVA|nr:hypothetical protein CHS0354_016963 [Potamilus streckersoni]
MASRRPKASSMALNIAEAGATSVGQKVDSTSMGIVQEALISSVSLFVVEYGVEQNEANLSAHSE